MHPLPPAPRLLVIKLSSLGDVLHALPTVRALRRGLGAGAIDWVTQPAYVELLRACPDVDEVLAFPRRGGLRAWAAFLRALRRRRYDLIVDLQGLLKSALVARLARGAYRLGPSFSREGAHLLYDAVAGPTDKARHAVEELLDVVRHLGLPLPTPPEFPLSLPRIDRPEPHPRIALLPCSRWPTKNWPVAHFAALARGLRRECQAQVFLAGAPEDQPACAAIAAAAGGDGVVNLCGQTSLVELGSLLQAMDLAVAVDSGPMHLAAAVGTPVVALFGATDPQRTGPYGPGHRVLTVEGLSCRPCRQRRCARGDLACLQQLSPERVLAAAQALLQR